MTPHNEAERDDYAGTVLLAGDPQRTRWIAETFLEAPRCVNRRREALGFTGTFRGSPISVQTTGIGASSFLIYTHELLDHFGPRTLIRIGTCGGLTGAAALRSVVISSEVRGEDSVSGQVFGLYDARDCRPAPDLLRRALEKAAELGIACRAGLTICSDVFYHPRGSGIGRFAAAQAAGAIAVDMETSALYRIAGRFGARALSICTVVDNIATGEETDYAERQALFTDMTRLALEVACTS